MSYKLNPHQVQSASKNLAVSIEVIYETNVKSHVEMRKGFNVA